MIIQNASVQFVFNVPTSGKLVEKIVTVPFTRMVPSNDNAGNKYVVASAELLEVPQTATLKRFVPHISSASNLSIHFGDYYVDKGNGFTKPTAPIIIFSDSVCPVLAP